MGILLDLIKVCIYNRRIIIMGDNPAQIKPRRRKATMLVPCVKRRPDTPRPYYKFKIFTN